MHYWAIIVISIIVIIDKLSSCYIQMSDVGLCECKAIARVYIRAIVRLLSNDNFKVRMQNKF
jgi:hypothetical protein